MRKQYLLFVICGLLCQRLFAVQATQEPLIVTQSDGTKLELYLHGNEFAHYYATKDGVPMERNTAGDYVVSLPAKRKALGAKMPEAVQATFPLQGKVRSIAILVNYTDVQFVTPNAKAAFTALLNEEGYAVNGGTGSAKDYFKACSNGLFNPQFDVYGPYTLSHDQAYYGANTATSSSAHAREMITEACLLAEKDGVDFSIYDEDGNGVVDNIFVYYAGYNEAEHGGENTVWPHRSAIYNGPTVSGKQIYDYACTSELRGNSEAVMCGIGTFCHEFSHVLGLPDLYVTTENENGGNTYTVGSWDIMSSGNYNNEGRTPPAYSAFERFMLGWLAPKQLTIPNNYTLEPIETGNTAYLIAQGTHNLNAAAPNPAEYFLVENRQYVGWDAGKGAIPGVGLLITHITYNATTYSNNTFNNSRPLGYDIVEAYSKNPTASSASDTYPGTAGVTAFLPQLNAGLVLNEQLLSGIKELSDGSVMFHYGLEDGTGFTFSPNTLETMVSTYDNRVIEYGVQEFEINGAGLTTDSVVLSVSSSFFEIGIDGVWQGVGSSYMEKVEADRTYHRTVQIRHTPRRQSCTAISGTFRVATTDGLMLNQLSLSGQAPRPTYITQVQALEATEITPYSFVANWEVQQDAEYYYLTLYKLYDEPSAIVQSFEKFTSYAAIELENWSSNFINQVTGEVGDGQYALAFRKTGDRVTSEVYPYPISGVSFWLSNTYIPVDGQTTGGVFVLEARSENGDWEIVDDNIRILRTTRNVIKTFDFAEDAGYVQFRLTYEHIGATGGAVIDAFKARMSKRIEYVYKGNEQKIFNDRAQISQSLHLNGLQSATTYYYQLQCGEEKGCNTHTTSLGNTIQVTTPWGVESDRQFTVVHVAENGLFAFLPVASDGTMSIQIYHSDGRLICSVSVPNRENSVQLPTDALQHGVLYLAKYSTESKMNRKDLWAKFIY